MDVETQKVTEVALKLNEEEARWLKGIMQNPFYGQTPLDETAQDSKMRGIFWTALAEVKEF